MNPEHSEIRKLLRDHPKIGSDELDKLELFGMIPADRLEDRAYYQGICRNTNVAKWVKDSRDPSKSCFYYIREKHESFYVENINHPSNDTGFDLFVPLRKIENE